MTATVPGVSADSHHTPSSHQTWTHTLWPTLNTLNLLSSFVESFLYIICELMNEAEGHTSCLTSASYHCQIPDRHFWGIFSDFPEPSQRSAGCLAGGAGTSPECAPTWIIQQPVWKMIVFGSDIDLPPVERRIYSLGAAAVEGVFVLFKKLTREGI